MATDIIAATARYEAWLQTQVDVVKGELKYKHAQMALKDDVFPFLRGTYYRWAEVWPEVCPECQSAPRVLAVGDLHVENFGTWRDRDGRLVWGINDFDEADDLPFTNDLVRLAVSAALGAAEGEFQFSLRAICRAIQRGYVTQLKMGGQPFVLEEEHPELREFAMQSDREPVKFWNKLNSELPKRRPELPDDAERALLKDLPGTDSTIRARKHVGMGSLGKPRFVALARFMGSLVAREAKALTPPASACLDSDQKKSRIGDVLASAIRCHDPIFHVDGNWIVRRLAPRCSRIDLDQLDCVGEKRMFEAMGAETANIHFGTPDATRDIRRWIRSQNRDWLTSAAAAMIKSTRDDWRAWRKHHKSKKQPK